MVLLDNYITSMTAMSIYCEWHNMTLVRGILDESFVKQHVSMTSTKASEYNKEMPQPYTMYQPMASRGRDTEHYAAARALLK